MLLADLAMMPTGSEPSPPRSVRGPTSRQKQSALQARFAGAGGEFESSSGRRGSCYPSHCRRRQTPGCRPNSANSSIRPPCHIQDHEFRRNAPSQWLATRPNAAGHIEILSSLPNESVAPTQWCLAGVFQNPDARQADLAAMRVSGKCQMGSAWYVREPHRIVRKYNARPFRHEGGQQLLRPSTLYPGIRDTHQVNRVIFDHHAPAFVIKDGDGMRAQCVRNFPRPVEVIMIS